MRTDIHRPSAIQPQDYQFVAAMSVKDIDFHMAFLQREELQKHMESTGGKYSSHEHGGSCHVCGAHCVDYAVFYHPGTNVYIRTGFDCAYKMDMGDPHFFRDFRTARKNAEVLKTGKKKAEKILKDAGLEQAWEIYTNFPVLPENLDAVKNKWMYILNTVTDITGNVVRYGGMSERQEKFMKSLLEQFNNLGATAEKQQKDRESAEDAPSGKTLIKGEVVSVKGSETMYGYQVRWTVKDERGFLVNSTIPAVLYNCKRGDIVEFSATLTPSDRDSKFAFGKRPTKAKLIKEVA